MVTADSLIGGSDLKLQFFTEHLTLLLYLFNMTLKFHWHVLVSTEADLIPKQAQSSWKVCHKAFIRRC